MKMSKIKILLITTGLAAIIFSFTLLLRKMEEGKRLFPFCLPWDDSAETVVSLSRFLEKPAGSHGHIRVGDDGHLYVNGKRIRLIGVNICGGAAFPSKTKAERIAARLAKFGVNIVRFHHMDASWEPFNIFEKNSGGTRHLNPEAMDRLDYFISELKKNGIYVDLNLLVSRRFVHADGLPPEIEEVDWKDQQVLGFFFEDVESLEREYARQLLTHLNPYTGLTYAEDPVVALVEIVNEQGLIQGWLGGVLERLPEVFNSRLRYRWNEYLRSKYGSDEELANAWSAKVEQPPVEFLRNGFFEYGTEGWVVEVHNGAEASSRLVEGPGGRRALEVKVSKLGSEPWHVQFNYPGLEVNAGQGYLLKFIARADSKVRISVALKQAHEPWNDISLRTSVELTPDWKEYELVLVVSSYEKNARLDISELGLSKATFQFSCFTLKPFGGYGLKEGESLEGSTVGTFTVGDFQSRTATARKDWVEFLYGLEEAYFSGMKRYLKEELGVKALVIGTIVGCSTPNLMSELDVIDTHAYWQHPAFPGAPWDPGNWYVLNEPMINHLDDGTISWLSLKRVYGKPHIVSEYNHPAPNMYDAETVITIATYAALQDWDGIFLFDYGSREDWGSERLRGYFDVDQHPVKMATLIPAYMIFARGDVKPADALVVRSLDRQMEVDMIASGRVFAWNLPDGRHLGMAPTTPLLHRTALLVGSGSGTQTAYGAETVGPVYVSDTGEVRWDISDPAHGVLVINSTRSIAVVGFGGGKRFELGDVTIEPGDSLLDGWSTITLSVVDGEDFGSWSKLLLVVAGYTANTGMKLREYESGKELAVVSAALSSIRRYNGAVTCDTNWGTAPTLTEGVPLRVELKTSEVIEVWALDKTGKRAGRVLVSEDGERKVFSVGPEYKTLWYEISVEG